MKPDAFALSPIAVAKLKALVPIVTVEALAFLPIASAPPNNVGAFATAPSPIPIAYVVRVLVQPLPLPIPNIEKQLASAGAAAPSAPVASAPETSAPSSALPVGRILFMVSPSLVWRPCSVGFERPRPASE